MDDSAPILVTGASGYIGGRLVPRLLERGYRVRCLARSPRKLARRSWSGDPRVEVVEGGLEDAAALARAFEGVRTAYYLVHSMVVAGEAYRNRDAELAQAFSVAAAEAGVRQIVYLGGLGETGDELSEHLASRREVERCLAAGGVPVTVLRAAMILGSGSASFEILRYLTERLPAMLTPAWVRTRCQPIAVRDVLGYLVAAIETPQAVGKTFEIGGPDMLSYEELIHRMARARGLPKRRILRVPVLSPRLSSHWIHLVTPVDARIARPLAEGLRNEVVCTDDAVKRVMPRECLGVDRAIELALANLDAHRVETSWSDAGPIPGDPDWSGGNVFTDSWQVPVRADAEGVFRAVLRVGGGHGWYRADFLWRLRGLLDQLVGGPGLRRGRRVPDTVRYGDALDFWRVVGLEEPRWLSLRAEMKLPGEALLEFRVEPDPEGGGSRLVQTARFIPRGLLGLAYWYSVMPLHGVVFRGMLDGIRRAAEREAAVDASEPALPVTRGA